MSTRIVKEVVEKSGDGKEIVFICWENINNPNIRGFYERQDNDK